MKKPSTLEQASEKVSSFLKDVKEFFQDIIETITDLIGLKTINRKKYIDEDEGTYRRRYVENTIKSGYKVLQNVIPILDMARSTIDNVNILLPNVTTTKFIQSLLTQLVPDLIKNQNNIQA